MARKTKVQECQEDVVRCEDALAKYNDENPNLDTELAAARAELEAARASYNAAGAAEQSVVELAHIRLGLRDNDPRNKYRFAPAFIAAVEAAVGIKYEDAESVRKSNSKHGLNPFDEALNALARRTIDEDAEVKAVRGRCRQALNADSSAHNKVYRLGRERQVLENKLREAQRDLRQAIEERDERLAVREEKKQDGSWAKAEEERRQAASAARAKLAQVASGDLKVTW